MTTIELMVEEMEGQVGVDLEKPVIFEAERIRGKLIERYDGHLGEISNVLARSREQALPREKPLLAVVVSLWEETDDLLAAKMFEISLRELKRQADEGGVNLDIFCVANNGGGKTKELGKKMRDRLDKFFASEEESYAKLDTSRPDGETNSATPWNLELPLDSTARSEDGNRIFFVAQEFTGDEGANAGKIRAIRDISSALKMRIVHADYAPDAIFQMDAESDLGYDNPVLQKEAEKDNRDWIPPLKALYNNLKRRGLKAVGTKDRFVIIDPETGKSTDTPVGSAQVGYMGVNTRDNFITLPGGALMAEPDVYLAGTLAIAETTPSVGTEDYLFTKILGNRDGSTDGEFQSADSMGLITHRNRAKPGRDSYRQLMKWIKDAKAVDKIFPEHPYKNESLAKYTALVIKSRITNAWEKRDVRFLKQLVEDVRGLPSVAKMLNGTKEADILNGAADWSHAD
ncbi:hypothetical protein KKB40_03725 [Patescibacteria group bacterium]|nr:hypothetical protein [Patescibacteria group bacterium]